MKKLALLMVCFLLIVMNNAYCYAVRSEIYENRLAYSSDLYDVYITTNLVENQLFNFYSNKKIEMSIIKKIKSRSYVNYIHNVIREFYAPPFWDPEYIVSKVDSAYANDDLWIQEKIYLDFRTRSVAIFDESLWTKEGKNPEIILNLDPEGTFHTDYSYTDMDNSPEYGGIANASIEFLESIKDIYFNESKRKEHELNVIHSRNFGYYWTSLARKWEKTDDIDPRPEKIFYTRFTDIYVDAQSIRWVDNYLEGWIRLDFDVERLITPEMSKEKQEKLLMSIPVKSALYYTRFDPNKKQFLVIAGYETARDGSVKKYVLKTPELWTYDSDPDIVAGVLNKVADIYNHKRDFWGSSGTR
jgi:hypothetical protein